jgi:hypothetical protein
MAAQPDTTSPPEPRLARAFGLALELGFDVAGLPHAPVDAVLPSRRVRVRMADGDAERRWLAASREVVLRQRFPGRAGVMLLERLGDDLLLSAPGAGAYLFAADGTRIECAPPDTLPWRWQRFLTGQVLPLASVLQGLEVLHASAVVYGDAAIAFCGVSGAGKTSLAAGLVQRGATILTDDVLALEPAGDAVLAHPGPRLLNLRHAEHRVRSAAGRGVPGSTLGADGKGLRVVMSEHARPVPLGALCVIERCFGGELEIERMAPDAPTLLATTFNFALRSPERMAAQLDVHARLARSAVLFRARVPPSVGSRALGMRLEAEVVRVLAAA